MTNIKLTLLAVVLMGIAMTARSDEYALDDAYSGLRELALGLTAETVQPRDGTFALLMETGYDVVMTVVVAADGATSIYFSDGGGIIGAGEYEQVREVVFETLDMANRHAVDMGPTDKFPLPRLEQTRFFLVTEDGVRTAAAREDLLGNEKHGLSPLFLQVHKLIAYIRAADEYQASQTDE